MLQFKSLTIILILWFTGLCAAAQFAKIGHVLPELQSLYPNAGSSLGFLVSLISLMGAMLGVIAGLLVRHFGSYSVLLAGLALGCLVSLIQSTELPFSVFLFSRVLEGLSHLAIVVGAPTLMALHSPSKMRAAAMTLWGTFFGVAYAVTAVLGLPLVEKYGVHALFLTHAVLIGIVTILVTIAVPKSPTPSISNHQKHTPPSKHNDKSDALNLRFIYALHKDSWTSPTIAAPAAGWLFYTITFVAMLAIVPTLLPESERAIALTVLPLVGIVISMTLGVLLLRRFSAVHVLTAGFIIAIVSALSFLVFDKNAFFMLLLFASLGLVQGASFAAIPQLNKSTDAQASANGAFAQAGNLGNVLGTPLLLLVVNSSGVTAMIAVVILCYLAAISIHLYFAKQRSQNPINSL